MAASVVGIENGLSPRSTAGGSSWKCGASRSLLDNPRSVCNSGSGEGDRGHGRMPGFWGGRRPGRPPGVRQASPRSLALLQNWGAETPSTRHHRSVYHHWPALPCPTAIGTSRVFGGRCGCLGAARGALFASAAMGQLLLVLALPVTRLYSPAGTTASAVYSSPRCCSPRVAAPFGSRWRSPFPQDDQVAGSLLVEPAVPGRGHAHALRVPRAADWRMLPRGEGAALRPICG